MRGWGTCDVCGSTDECERTPCTNDLCPSHETAMNSTPLRENSDLARLARYITIYGGKPKFNYRTGDRMSTTVKITFTEPETGRVRAQIEAGEFGIFAEAADEPTAAAKVVKAYFGVDQPAEQTAQAAPNVEPRSTWRYPRPVIRQLLEGAVLDAGRIEIQYEDALGHETTRVLRPSNVDNTIVYGYDELRQGVRSLRVDRIKAAREV